jgi:hypothetical protein
MVVVEVAAVLPWVVVMMLQGNKRELSACAEEGGNGKLEMIRKKKQNQLSCFKRSVELPPRHATFGMGGGKVESGRVY